MPTDKRQRKKAGRQAQQQAMAAARRRKSRQRTVIIIVVLVAIAALIAGVTGAFSGGGSSSDVASTGSSTTQKPPPTVKGNSITGDTPCPKADGSSPRTTGFAKPPPMCIDPNKTYTATMETTQGGPITIALDAKQAPKTVNNFVVLARYHFFDGLTFHRIVPDFVIQGGDPQGNGQGGPGYNFADELPQAGQYKIGSLAMANSGPNTNGSQFFIITGQQGVQLQPNYSLFGQVTGGMDVVNKIAALGDANAPNGEPKQQVSMKTVTIQES
jgi:cyclophilin family peptidyl-prolyl cis-trans isomerase